MSAKIERKNPDAQILVEIGLVEYGYQLDIQCDTTGFGKTMCGDFAGNYKIKDMETIILEELPKWIKSLEKSIFERQLKEIN